MHIIGRGRHARETYPTRPQSSAGAQNLSIGAPPIVDFNAPFVPGTSPPTLFAAKLYTPKTSGLIQVNGNMAVVNDVNAEIYGFGIVVITGTGLSVSGGSVTQNGWVFGTSTPPVIGGVQSGAQIITAAGGSVAASGQLVSAFIGISNPALPVGVPVVLAVEWNSVGGHGVTGVSMLSISAQEL